MEPLTNAAIKVLLFTRLKPNVGLFLGQCFVILSLIIPVISAQHNPGMLAAKGISRLPKKIKLDRDYDGRVDRIDFFDEYGSLIRTEVDSNADGKLNEIILYENNRPATAEKDLNGDGHADMFLTYDDSGKLAMSKTDTDYNGIADIWIFYKAGVPVRSEKDSNANGKPDIFTVYGDDGKVLRTESHYDGDEKGELFEPQNPNDVLFFHNGKLY